MQTHKFTANRRPQKRGEENTMTQQEEITKANDGLQPTHQSP